MRQFAEQGTLSFLPKGEFLPRINPWASFAEQFGGLSL